jgi:hypothetical protein
MSYAPLTNLEGLISLDIQVQLSALQAFASFFHSLSRKSQQKYYNLVADVLNILPPLKQNGDSDELTKALMALIELAEAAPKMFKGYFNSLVTFSITVIQDKELTDIARQNALELMATFADSSAAMCKKDPNYTSEMVTQCLSLMTDVGPDDDDASEWASTEDVSFSPGVADAMLTVPSLKLTRAMPTMLQESKHLTDWPIDSAELLFCHPPSTGCLE